MATLIRANYAFYWIVSLRCDFKLCAIKERLFCLGRERERGWGDNNNNNLFGSNSNTEVEGVVVL